MLKKISKNTVATQVINQLIHLIRSGAVKEGDRLPSEREMAEQLGVSRPPIRESLRVLEYAGVIETRYGDGIYVKNADFPPDGSLLFSRILHQYTLEDLIEMRKVLEAASVRFAVGRANDEDLDNLQGIQTEMLDSLDNMEKFIECDFAFHSAIAESTRNSMLYQTIQTMRKMMGEFNRDLLQRRSYRQLVCRHHQAILDGILHRNVEAALQAMDAHLNNVVSMSVIAQEQLEDAGDTAPSASRAAVSPLATPAREDAPRTRRPRPAVKLKKSD